MTPAPVFLLLILSSGLGASVAEAIEKALPPIRLYVNCSLSSDGAYPLFASVSSAQQHIRQSAVLRNSSVTMHIAGVCRPSAPGDAVLSFASELDVDQTGVHRFTVEPWGTPSDAAAVFSGEIVLQPSRWAAGASSPLLQLTLTKQELALLGPAGFGAIGNGQLGQCTTTKLELFSLAQPMVLARHPNPTSLALYNGPWMDWMHVAPQTASFPEAYSFLFESSKCVAWAGNYSASNVWLHGFWSYDWADNYIRVTSIRVSTHGAAGDAATPSPALCRVFYDPSTPPVYGIVGGARFYILNLPSEVDSAGEYFIDEPTATITLFWPTATQGPLPVLYLNAASGQPLIAQSAGVLVTGVTIQGLELRFARSSGLALPNVQQSVSLADLTVHSVGSSCAYVAGAGFIFSGSSISRCGCSGLSVSGGDFATLQPANLVVDGNSVTQYARWTRTYQPGISFYGVGLLVQRNRVFDAPHQGMTGGANNAVFRNNYFGHLCFEVRDSSAWYIGRSWVHRGVVVANNVFEHIQALEPTALGSDCVSGIYLDDQQSGVTVVNNTCNDVFNCILLGGGRDNALLNNNCLNVTTCVLFDNRGMNWQSSMCTYNATYSGLLVQQLYAVHYQAPPYSVQYPKLPGLLTDWPCVPVNNSLIGNTYCIAPGGFVDQSNETIVGWGSRMYDNTVKCP